MAYSLGAHGRGTEILSIPDGGSHEPLTAESLAAGRQFMQMDGRAVFKWTVNKLTDSIRRVIQAAGLTTNDLKLVILHQANRRILDAAADALGIAKGKLVTNLDRFGNTSAGSIPSLSTKSFLLVASTAATTSSSPASAPASPGALAFCAGNSPAN
jgi:3-oxoacyl-[acyl-carrier-protein] synthase-3